jgi:hypothetical protein
VVADLETVLGQPAQRAPVGVAAERVLVDVQAGHRPEPGVRGRDVQQDADRRARRRLALGRQAERARVTVVEGQDHRVRAGREVEPAGDQFGRRDRDVVLGREPFELRGEVGGRAVVHRPRLRDDAVVHENRHPAELVGAHLPGRGGRDADRRDRGRGRRRRARRRGRRGDRCGAATGRQDEDSGEPGTQPEKATHAGSVRPGRRGRGPGHRVG